MWEGGFVIKAKETKLYLNGEEIKCAIVDFSMDGGAIYADDVMYIDAEQFEAINGCMGFEFEKQGIIDLVKILRALPKPKKQSWQGEGKRRKPRIK